VYPLVTAEIASFFFEKFARMATFGGTLARMVNTKKQSARMVKFEIGWQEWGVIKH